MAKYIFHNNPLNCLAVILIGRAQYLSSVFCDDKTAVYSLFFISQSCTELIRFRNPVGNVELVLGNWRTYLLVSEGALLRLAQQIARHLSLYWAICLMILFHDFYWRLTGEKCNKGTDVLRRLRKWPHTICGNKQTRFIEWKHCFINNCFLGIKSKQKYFDVCTYAIKYPNAHLDYYPIWNNTWSI